MESAEDKHNKAMEIPPRNRGGQEPSHGGKATISFEERRKQGDQLYEQMYGENVDTETEQLSAESEEAKAEMSETSTSNSEKEYLDKIINALQEEIKRVIEARVTQSTPE